MTDQELNEVYFDSDFSVGVKWTLKAAGMPGVAVFEEILANRVYEHFPVMVSATGWTGSGFTAGVIGAVFGVSLKS